MICRVFYILLILAVFSPFQVLQAQDIGIEITHKKGKRVKFLKENRRIKVFTQDGEKVKGRLEIIDNQTIRVKDKVIKLKDVVLIRKKDVGTSIAKAVGIGLGTTLIVASVTSSNVFTVLIGTSFGIGLDVLALVLPEIAIGNLDNKRWSYKIIN